MHKEMLKTANEEQAKLIAITAINALKDVDEDAYDTLERELYMDVYGCHFTGWRLDEALKGLINEDGTTGPKWSVDQTSSVARSHGIRFDGFNEYDWNFVMNMVYSDFYGSVPDSVDTYVAMSKRFINDKDAPEGKAYLYWCSMDNAKKAN